jgi:glycosyltransferase involved in cell wall biosynthesis
VSAIVAGSENTKQDIIKYYGIDPSRISVIYPGVDDFQFHFVPRECPHQSPYILYVGNQYSYKNLVRLIEAFSRLTKHNQTHHLFLVGKKDLLYYPVLESMVREFGLEPSVKFIDYLPNKELPLMYAQADLFVFPSLYEGFGLPAIEAMACGCPVVASDCASLPEVCGDAALYFSPTDVSDMARAISTVLEVPELRAQMIARGYKRVQEFKWEKTAKRYLALLSKT